MRFFDSPFDFAQGPLRMTVWRNTSALTQNKTIPIWDRPQNGIDANHCNNSRYAKGITYRAVRHIGF